MKFHPKQALRVGEGPVSPEAAFRAMVKVLEGFSPDLRLQMLAALAANSIPLEAWSFNEMRFKDAVKVAMRHRAEKLADVAGEPEDAPAGVTEH